MIFCQACGARNTDEARFCNICGARIASTGEPGGPIVPGGAVTRSEPEAPKTTPMPAASGTTGTGTSTTMSGSRVSLEAIGVRSSGRTYAILAGAALALMALGALGMWIAMRGDEPSAPVAEGDAGAEADPAPDVTGGDEIVVGDPIAEGEEMPEGVDIVTTGPRATKRGSSGGTRPTGTTPRATGGSGTTTSGSGSVTGAGAGTSGTGTSGTGSTGTGSSGTGSSGTGSSGTGSSGTGSGTGSSGTGTSGTGSTGTGTSGTDPATGGTDPATGTGGTTTRDWDAMEEDAPDERDLAMEGYSTHVRRVIREFYIRRAQTCFDHESARDGEAVRGTVVIGFTIEQSGEVVNTTIDRNTTGRDALASCLSRQVDQWRLPPPPAEMGDVDMQMPFSR